MLQLHRISSIRHRTGLRVAALAILLAGFGGYALRAGASAVSEAASADKTSISTSVDVEIDGKSATRIRPRILALTGEKSSLRFAPDAGRKVQGAEIAFTASRLSGDRVRIDAELHLGDSLVGSPRVITHDGEAARVEVKSADGAHVFAVTLVPRLVAPQAAQRAL